MENSTEVKVESVSAINSQNVAVDVNAVPVTGALQIKFSEAVTKESVNVNNVRVYEVTGNVPVSIPASNMKLSADGMTATLNLDGVSLDKSKEYKVVVKDVKNAEGTVVTEKTVNFKTADVAVVKTVTLKASSPVASATGNNAPTGVNSIEVAFDEKLSPSTVTTSNVSLVDVNTGKKIPLNLTTNDKTIVVGLDSALPDGKQYTLSINGVKTATGEDAEAVTKTFAVAAEAPLAKTELLTTVDGKTAGTGINAVWPKLTSGTTEAGDYKPGLKLNISYSSGDFAAAAKLDPSTIQDNVQLVEKESKAVVPATITYNSDAKMLSVVPNADLKEATAYEIQFKGGLKSAEGIYLDAAKKNEVVTGESLGFTTLDITAPTVTSVTSKNGETSLKVSEAQEFTVKLSEPAALSTNNVVLAETGTDFNDQASITAKRIAASEMSVTLVPGTTDTYKVKLKANAARVQQNKAYKLVVVGKDLAQSALVTNVSSNNNVSVVADAAGNTLKNSSTTTFTTEGVDVTAPKVSKIYKGTTLTAANEVSAPTNITAANNFTFVYDEAILDTASNITTSKVVLERFNGSTWVTDTAPTVSTTAVNNAAGEKVGLNVALTGVTVADAKYRIVVKPGAVKDAAGNLSTEEKVFEFIGTEGDDTAASVVVKTGSVSAGAFTPGEATDDDIFVVFNEDEIFEVESSSVKVTDKDGAAVAGTLTEIDAPTGALVPVGFTAPNKVYKFTPESKLDAGAVYTVTVEGVKDIVGNTIGKKVVQFTTTAAAVKVAETSVADGTQAVDRQKTITVKLTKARALTVGTPGSLSDGQISLTAKTPSATNVTGLAVTSSNNVDHNINFSELAANTEYVLTIKVEGETKVINFTTGVESTDVVKPTFTAVGTINAGLTFTPATGTNPYGLVSLTDDIALQFSKAVKLDASSKVVITEVSENKEVAILETAVKTPTTGSVANTLTINPVLDLTAGKTYKVSVTGVKDLAGNVANDIMIYVVAP